MADPQDLEFVAADYVLGVLDADERRAFARRIAREPQAAAAVRGWQERLAPLALALPPRDPPAALFTRIEASIAKSALPTPANDDRAGPWRWATAAAVLVAAIASGFALRAPPAPLPAALPRPVSFAGGVAALSAVGSEPALLVTVDRTTHRLRVLPVNLPEDTRHSLELWAIHGHAAPVALGVIDPRDGREQGRVAATDGLVLAVSREPRGGSPTGLPTGPVLFTGKLVDLPAS